MRNSIVSKVTRAVIPAAGRGTRLRPLTYHAPKELLPVGEKPMIQYALEAHMAAGISEFCIITSPEKPQLRHFLTGNWKPPLFPFERDAAFFEKLGHCRLVFAVQDRPTGVANAVGLARDFVADEPFVCVMPDCILFSDTPLTRQILEVFEKHGQNVIGAIAVRHTEVHRFGNVGLLKTERLDHKAFRITSLSDKSREPIRTKPGQTVHKGFGGGVYLPGYFDLISAVTPAAKGEVDDVPIHQILIHEKTLVGLLLKGAAFDAGHPLGFRAAVHYAGRLRV